MVVFKSRHGGTLHPVTTATRKALTCFCLFGIQFKPPAMRGVVDSPETDKYPIVRRRRIANRIADKGKYENINKRLD